jgi:hypothetical protein
MRRILPKTSRLVSLVIALIALGLYISSIFSEAWSVYGLDSGGTVTGLDCLLAPMREPTTLLNPVWWANVLFGVGVVALCGNRPGLAASCGVVGLLLAIACWLHCRAPSAMLVLFDLGSYTPHTGFFLWLASMAVVACSVLPLLWPCE